MMDHFIKGPILVTILLSIIIVLLLFQYKNLLKIKIIKFSKLLLSLRSIVFLILLYLLINPLIRINKTNVTKPVIGLFIDSSKSISIHQSLDSIDYNNSISLLKNNLVNNGYKTMVFKFSDTVMEVDDLDKISFVDNTTNYDFLDNKTINHTLDKVILITDGVSTYGRKIEQLSLDRPVYSIGIGGNHFIEDIQIDKIIYDKKIKFNDSLELTYAIKSFLKEKKSSKLIIKNIFDKILYSSSINFERGNRLIDGKVKIASKDLTSVNSIVIQPLEMEINKKNNSKVFDLDIIDKPKSILLVSGAISNNTFFIKKNIESIKNISLDHFYRINDKKWNKNLNELKSDQYDLIIFDDYIDKNEISFKEKKSIIYFEGSSSFSYKHEFLNDIFKMESIINEEQKSEKIINSNIGINRVNFELLPRFNKNYNYFSNNDSNVLLRYADNSVAIIRNKNNIGVFIPDLGNNYRKSNNFNQKSVLNDLMNKIMDISFDQDISLIRLKEFKNEYFIGDLIKIYIEYSPLLNPLEVNNFLEIKAYKDSLIQLLDINYDYTRDKYYCSYDPSQSGFWKVQGKMNYNNKLIESKTLNLLVQDYDLESNFVSQNINGLKLLSKRSGGEYLDIKDITKKNSSLNFDDKIKNELVEFNTTNYFNYLWIMILILSLEWYFRKRKGLL